MAPGQRLPKFYEWIGEGTKRASLLSASGEVGAAMEILDTLIAALVSYRQDCEKVLRIYRDTGKRGTVEPLLQFEAQPEPAPKLVSVPEDKKG